MSKLAYTPKEAAREAAVKLDLVKECISLRTLPAREAEGEPVVLHADLAEWVEKLPSWEK